MVTKCSLGSAPARLLRRPGHASARVLELAASEAAQFPTVGQPPVQLARGRASTPAPPPAPAPAPASASTPAPAPPLAPGAAAAQGGDVSQRYVVITPTKAARLLPGLRDAGGEVTFLNI